MSVRQSVFDRLKVIAEHLNVRPVAAEAWNVEAIVEALVARLDIVSVEASYLILAVFRAEIPTSESVLEASRRWRSEGLGSLLDAERHRLSRRFRTPPVRVASSIIVDVTDTARSRFTTGIQRVARESLARWPEDEIELVCWSRGKSQLHAATMEERALVLGSSSGNRADSSGDEVLIPFRAALVLPEIAVEARRYAGLRSIARYSGSRALAIGFDCIPITTGEVVAPGMSGAFASYLSALAAFDEIVAISGASAEEFEGWRRMLGGAGLEGPQISAIDLPFSAEDVSDATMDRVRSELDLDDGIPVVLAIGSHEPRKNHVGFLHAAELLWREGHDFTVVMVGGNSWDTDVFDALVEKLRVRGRRILTISGADDDTVWSLYRIALFSVFCSLNEGFGLPVAESLAAGTPAITSGFGSMKALGDGHGALLVDPRDPHAIADAMRTLITDGDRMNALVEQTASLPKSSWDDYASGLWARVRVLAGNAA